MKPDQYDNEGNRTARFVDTNSNSQLDSGDTSITEYEWDHRNRLTKVTTRDTYGGAPTQIVEYMYDAGRRWVRKTLDTNGDSTIESSRIFVHDNGQIVLDFQKSGTAAASNADLANRYLWGNSVDELLTDELVDDGSKDDNLWAATDHLNSVRDLLVYNPVTETVSVIKHVTFDAFGQETSDSAPGLITLHGFTARPFDPDTGNNNNGFRWYDLSTGRWMSTDPIGFEAGDVNLYRYVENASLTSTDSTGLITMAKLGLPWMSGRAWLNEVHSSEVCCIRLYVDGILRGSVNPNGAGSGSFPFDYNWLKRVQAGKRAVYGTITLTTNLGVYNASYVGMDHAWMTQSNPLKPLKGQLQGFGVYNPYTSASGSYTKYWILGGEPWKVTVGAAVWNNAITIKAGWAFFKKQEGLLTGIIENVSSVFGQSHEVGTTSTSEHSNIGGEGPSIGRPLDMDAAVVFPYKAVTNKWFIARPPYAKLSYTMRVVRSPDPNALYNDPNIGWTTDPVSLPLPGHTR